MIICGGRNEAGEVLNDVWCLEASVDCSSATTTASIKWRAVPEMVLPGPRCAHAAAGTNDISQL